MAERRIVDKETFITHISALERDDTSAISSNGYEATMCGLYFNSTQWHASWRSPPHDKVTCLMCLAGEDYS